ncbi:MAG: 4Fe-4S double cluster binding domain-containing protein [Candidatus Thorarchaeota archaeon]
MTDSKLIKNLEKIGYKATIVSAKHIPELKNDIKKYHDNNLLYPPFYETYKVYFEFKPEPEFEEINSIIVLTKPVPQFEAKFIWKGKHISLFIPPTYLYGQEIIDNAKNDLERLLTPDGNKVTYAIIPQKTLAVRSGLASYGRNNITYVPELGSFHRLIAFYSDFISVEDNWQELQMMDTCNNCNACVNKCPTKAIPTDRFLLRAEKCLTYHNEQPGNIPFPEWIDISWHNCLVGCLYCQKVCPANKKVKDWIEPGPSFSESETTLILNEQKFESLPDTLKEKLTNYDLINYFEILPRNLKVFLGK